MSGGAVRSAVENFLLFALDHSAPRPSLYFYPSYLFFCSGSIKSLTPRSVSCGAFCSRTRRILGGVATRQGRAAAVASVFWMRFSRKVGYVRATWILERLTVRSVL
jgi:hypothetical protein